MNITDFSKRHQFVSKLRDIDFPGTGILARFLSKIIIPKPVDDILLKTQYDFILNIFPKTDTGVERSLYYTGTYEKGLLNLFKDFLKPGETFIDIGANIGLMSIFASKIVGEKGKVFSFEPNPSTLQLLHKNLSLNSIKNVTVCPFALGSENAAQQIYANWHINRGGASLVKPTTDSESFDIEVVRFDMFYNEHIKSEIALIKIDVEGFEMQVLGGFGNILEQTSPYLIIECGEERGDVSATKVEVYNYVNQLNLYSIYKLKRGKERVSKLVKINSSNELPTHDNIICIPASKLNVINKTLFA